MIVWDHWHIEPSSICALRCPRCPRAEVPQTLLNQQLNLDFFQQQITADVVRDIRRITLCGNDGDPIYCRDLVAICAWIKSVNPRLHLVIVTNGSHRPQEFWRELACTLDHNDEIHWSIDGWDHDSNRQYRVNSDWHSIHQGIQTFLAHNQTTYTVWASIAFAFNEQHIPDMCDIAQRLGLDQFQLTKSTKFGSHYPEVYGTNDALQPTQSQYRAQGHRFEREITVLSQKARPGHEMQLLYLQRAQQLQQQQRYSALCMIGNKGVFVNSRGEFYPCCWTANRYIHNHQWQKLAADRFNLWQRSFPEIISDEFWHTDFLRFDSQECSTKCTPERLRDVQHTTEW
jgi:MoaA/NifB/PqqE/SkfB family radical SAM enzyme